MTVEDDSGLTPSVLRKLQAKMSEVNRTSGYATLKLVIENKKVKYIATEISEPIGRDE